MKTSPRSMLSDWTHFRGANLLRMARGQACDPESPGSRRGLFVDGSRDKKPRVETRGLRA